MILLSILVVTDSSGFPLPPCPDCQVMHVDGPLSPTEAVDTVILSGHSAYDHYLGLDTERLAQLLHDIAPNARRMVMDTCFGAQAELMLTLHRAGLRFDEVVAVADWLPPSGLDYRSAFTGAGAEPVRITGCCGTRWRPVTRFEPDMIGQLYGLVFSTRWATRWCLLDAPLVSVMPNLVRMPANDTRGPVLVHIPAEYYQAGCHR